MRIIASVHSTLVKAGGMKIKNLLDESAGST